MDTTLIQRARAVAPDDYFLVHDMMAETNDPNELRELHNILTTLYHTAEYYAGVL